MGFQSGRVQVRRTAEQRRPDSLAMAFPHATYCGSESPPFFTRLHARPCVTGDESHRWSSFPSSQAPFPMAMLAPEALGAAPACSHTLQPGGCVWCVCVACSLWGGFTKALQNLPRPAREDEAQEEEADVNGQFDPSQRQSVCVLGRKGVRGRQQSRKI